MELFTKKNILITSAIIIGIAIVAGGAIYGTDFVDSLAYSYSKRNREELGKTEEKLKENIHSALKNKNRDKAYAIHCLDGASNTKSRRDSKDQKFNEFWEQALKEDYSESTVRLEDYDNKRSATIYIENIKADDGDSFSREFLVTRDSSYYCSGFIPFYSYEEKAYYSEVEMRKYENSQTNN